LRGEPHRVEDLRVAGAAAEVAGERLADLVFARVGDALEQRGRGNDEPGRAEPALHRSRLDERLLHVLQTGPFHGGDLVSVGLRGEHEACAHELPVEDDRARSALALLASVLRSGQPEALTQGEEEALALPHVGLASLPVDRQRDLHATVHLSIARVASTRSACRRYAAVPRTSSIGLAAATTRSANPSSSPVTSAATGPDEPKAARASLRSRSTLSASEHTAITIAFLGPTFMNVCAAPLGSMCTARMSSSSASALRL